MALTARLDKSDASYSDVVGHLNERANFPMVLARQTGFVPLRRGFSEPTHNATNVSLALTNEKEVAMSLAGQSERFSQYEISRYVEKIANRRIQMQSQIGKSAFSIDSIPTGTGVPASIVNEGFGINQLVYLLTICLYSRYRIVAIEEPEIHLHPSMVRELAIALAEIAVEKDRRLIVSTHSETFVVALLSQIAAGKIKTGDVSFVLAENPNGSTILTQQNANRKGQIEGGLRAFMASEAKDLVDFLGLSSE
jgi:predicted ATPase